MIESDLITFRTTHSSAFCICVINFDWYMFFFLVVQIFPACNTSYCYVKTFNMVTINVKQHHSPNNKSDKCLFMSSKPICVHFILNFMKCFLEFDVSSWIQPVQAKSEKILCRTLRFSIKMTSHNMIVSTITINN